MQHYWELIHVQCAVPHAIKAFRNNVFTGCITFFSVILIPQLKGPIKACTFKSFAKNNNRPLCHSFTESESFLSPGHGTVWGKGATFLGTQCVLRGPRWRLGMGRGCGVLRGGGFHLWHHQELRHLPSGPHGGIWGDQQSGPVDRFHLRVCHDVQWWANEGEKKILKYNDVELF